MMQKIKHRFLDGSAKRLLINGEWLEAVSGETFESTNPATGDQLDRLARGGAADVDLAVTAARKAFNGPWSRFTPLQRQRALLKLADLVEENLEALATLDSVDMGAPIALSRQLTAFGADVLRYAAAQALAIRGDTIGNSQSTDLFTYTLKEPIGVVGAIIPWNAPLYMAIWKLAPVLATGCTVVLKPAEHASFTPLWLGELCLSAGIPPGVVNVVTGAGEAGEALASHPDVDKIAFTGSTKTGQHIIRASAVNAKRLTMELGGKSPHIVFADADLEAAAQTAAMSVFLNSGQSCSCGTRLFVERKVYDQVTQRVAEIGKSLQVGDPLSPNTVMGPVASRQQLDRVCGYLDAGMAEGAIALTGGARMTEGEMADGYFVPPTLFVGVSDNMKIAREEIFGPVISALPFDDTDEVLARANQTHYGLGSGVWTRDVSKILQFTRGIRAGVVWVNTYGMADPAMPFGGYKMSGFGRENGREHIEAYLETKAVWIKP